MAAAVRVRVMNVESRVRAAGHMHIMIRRAGVRSRVMK
jgi:hypothetical protein